MKKVIIAAVIVLAVCFVSFFAAGAFGERDTVIRYDNLAAQPIKNYDEYLEVLDAETVSRSERLSAPFDIESKITEKKFKKKFYNLIYADIAKIPSSTLYGEKGCYLSVLGAAAFNVPSNTTVDSMRCFIFTKDLEEAGTLYFTKAGITVSVNDKYGNIRHTVLKKLSAEKDKRFVILSNGLETKLLDSENNIVNVGASHHKLEISGDCYSVLNGLSVSYDDIVKEENLIWFDFDN